MKSDTEGFSLLKGDGRGKVWLNEKDFAHALSDISSIGFLSSFCPYASSLSTFGYLTPNVLYVSVNRYIVTRIDWGFDKAAIGCS